LQAVEKSKYKLDRKSRKKWEETSFRQSDFIEMKNAGWLKSPIFICLKSMVITPKYFSKWKATINKSLNQIEENFLRKYFLEQ
jgi:hypothetical protein